MGKFYPNQAPDISADDEEAPPNSGKLLNEIIDGLTEQLGRLPTDDEVYTFIFGSHAERTEIWNRRAQIE